MVASNTDVSPKKRSRLSVTLWILQVLLAGMFVYAGVMKLIHPVEMAQAIGLGVPFLYFLGIAEVLGGLGLVLPGLLRIKPSLTPLAAACLLVVMIGAVVMGLMARSVPGIAFPLVTGLLLALITYGRSRLVPLRG
jgi:uncharacterized membrane protein YphA (DoxX/SURF4 family)